MTTPFWEKWRSITGDILANPEKGAVEDYARKNKKWWVRITIVLQDGMQVPAIVKMSSGKAKSIHYPDGSATHNWTKRRETAAKCRDRLLIKAHPATTSLIKPTPKPMLALTPGSARVQTLVLVPLLKPQPEPGPRPVSEPISGSVRASQPAEPPLEPKPPAQTQQKEEEEKEEQTVSTVRFVIGGMAALIFFGIVTLVAAIVLSGGKKESSAQNRQAVAISAPATKEAAKELPFPLPPKSEVAGETPQEGQPSIPTPLAPARPNNPHGADESADLSLKTDTTSTVSSEKSCIPSHMGDLNITMCECEHQTQDGVVCHGWAVNGGNEAKELAIKARNTVDDDLGYETAIYHGDIVCGNSQKVVLYPGEPVNCYLKYADKSKGASKEASFHFDIRWGGVYGTMPSINRVPIS